MLTLLVDAGATFDASKAYRYVLWRNFVPEPTDPCLFIMLNPSTATEFEDDPTVRKCQSFARRWGHDACRVVNIFAYRSANPAVLLDLPDPIGPENDAHILTEASGAQRIICAWGNHGLVLARGPAVRLMLMREQRASWCFGQNQSGEPVHPLYQPSSQPLFKFT